MKKISLTDLEAVEAISDIATNVCNLEQGILKSKSRRQELMLPRIAVTNIALLEKQIHYKTIAEALNRDRTSIYYFEKQHEALYGNWRQYRDVFNDIYNSFKEQKKRYLTEEDLKNILNEAGVKNEKNAKVFIDIKINSVFLRIRSSYKNFTSTVEKIKKALKHYICDINIQL